jgi:hypothetical protein
MFTRNTNFVTHDTKFGGKTLNLRFVNVNTTQFVFRIHKYPLRECTKVPRPCSFPWT